jgi:hypothetical protein
MDGVNMKRLLVLLAFGPLFGSPVRAEFYTGNELLQRMQSDSVIEKSVALGFVAGVADTMEGILICSPDYATTGQARDVVLRHLLLNPQSRHKTAAALAVDALSAAWPCKRAK